MDVDDAIPIILIGLIAMVIIVIVAGAFSSVKQEITLKEASQSAQIQTICDRDYKDKSYKDVPIKCLEFWGFTKKQEGK